MPELPTKSKKKQLFISKCRKKDISEEEDIKRLAQEFFEERLGVPMQDENLEKFAALLYQFLQTYGQAYFHGGCRHR